MVLIVFFSILQFSPANMAEALHNINDFTESYQVATKEAKALLDRIDITKPDENIIEAAPATMTLLKIQAETQANAIGETLEFIKNVLPLQPLTGDDGAEALSIQQQKDKLDLIGQKN